MCAKWTKNADHLCFRDFIGRPQDYSLSQNRTWLTSVQQKLLGNISNQEALSELSGNYGL